MDAAQRSAAAREIKVLIDDSVGKVDTGARLVDQAGVTMNEVVDSVKRVIDIMAQIALASQEQNAGIVQISQAITQMDQVTQQNAALAEEAAAAAESMQEQAAHLAQAVDAFKLGCAAAGAEIGGVQCEGEAVGGGLRSCRARRWQAMTGSSFRVL